MSYSSSYKTKVVVGQLSIVTHIDLGGRDRKEEQKVRVEVQDHPLLLREFENRLVSSVRLPKKKLSHGTFLPVSCFLTCELEIIAPVFERLDEAMLYKNT